MASPLAWFRKYQKVLLGFFGVMLMIAFTVSLGTGVDPLVDFIAGGAPGGGPAAKQVAVQWSGGKLYESDLQMLRYNRVLLVRFLMAVAAGARARGVASTVPPVPLTDAEDSLVQSHLLAAQAKDMGVLVSDEMITDYLKGWGGNRVSTGELASILKVATDGRMTQDQLFGILRGELMAQNVWLMAKSGLYPTSPVAAWDFYSRLNRLVQAELMGIRVDDFLQDVADPTEGELSEFYEKYKDRYARPDSFEPGFKERRKIAFELARADFAQFLGMELPGVTDAEIAEYYEQHKDDYRKAEETSAGKDSSDRTDRTDPTDQSDESGRPGASDLEITPSDPSTKDQDNPIQEQPDTNFSPPAGPPGVDSSTPQSPGPDDPVQSGREAAPNAPAADDSADSNSDVTSGPGDTSTQPPAPGQPFYLPLDEVREAVRAAIARPRAQKKMNETIGAVRAEVDRYFHEYTLWKFETQDNPNARKPPLPDFAAVTGRYQGLTIERTGLVDRIQIQKYDIGQAYDRRPEGIRISFADVAFDEDAEPYKARVFPQSEIHDVSYLFWKVDQREAIVPQLSEIRPQVVRAWKMQPARAVQRAMEAAERYADRARQSPGKSLAELFAGSPGRTFIETDRISWMTTGSLPLDSSGDPWTASPIPGVEDAGHDFREKLFRLHPGQVGVAANEPRTMVYVIRMLGETPDQQELQDQFLKSGATFAVQYLAFRENQRVLQQWYRTLLEKIDLTWLREPEGPSEELF
jgi:hypothetical protein